MSINADPLFIQAEVAYRRETLSVADSVTRGTSVAGRHSRLAGVRNLFGGTRRHAGSGSVVRTTPRHP